MGKTIRTAIAMSFLVTASPAYAADVNGNYQMYGTGRDDCAKFLLAFDESILNPKTHGLDAYADFLGGYLSAINSMTPGKKDITRGRTISDLLLMAANYCRAPVSSGTNFEHALAIMVAIFQGQ